MEEKKVWCPLTDWDCPYFNTETGYCTMPDEGADPHEECDAFYGLDEE